MLLILQTMQLNYQFLILKFYFKRYSQVVIIVGFSPISYRSNTHVAILTYASAWLLSNCKKKPIFIISKNGKLTKLPWNTRTNYLKILIQKIKLVSFKIVLIIKMVSFLLLRFRGARDRYVALKSFSFMDELQHSVKKIISLWEIFPKPGDPGPDENP